MSASWLVMPTGRLFVLVVLCLVARVNRPSREAMYSHRGIESSGSY